LISWRKDEIYHLEYLKSSQVELLSQIESIQGIHNQTTTEIQFILNALLALEQQVDAVIEKYNHIVQFHVRKTTDQLNQIELYQQNQVNTIVNVALAGFETMESHLSKMMDVQKDILDNWNETHVYKPLQCDC
jgi:hypothetical protein